MSTDQPTPERRTNRARARCATRTESSPLACKGTAKAVLDLSVPESVAFVENEFAAEELVSDLLPS